MGAYSPAVNLTPEMDQRIRTEILEPLEAALHTHGLLYRGILFIGLMITEEGPMVLEFNTRFGDPETQAVLLRLKTDFLEVARACVDGHLDQLNLEFDERCGACVVAASEGYPDQPITGRAIVGMESVEPSWERTVFHAGTRLDDGILVTGGGRVLGAAALGSTVTEAVTQAVSLFECLRFEGMHYRRDIGHRVEKGS
jgi:phosphoribosylamine--glycine ligase